MERLLVDALDVQRVRQIQVGATFDLAGLPAVQADDAFRRLVLRAHQRERFLLAELLPPQLGDPVGIGVLERRGMRIVLGQGREQRRDAFGKPAHDRVRERHRPLEARGANELDRLVHGCVRRHVRVAELVRAEP